MLLVVLGCVWIEGCCFFGLVLTLECLVKVSTLCVIKRGSRVGSDKRENLDFYFCEVEVFGHGGLVNFERVWW